MLPKLEVIRNGYSYHETSGPAAPPRVGAHGDTYTAEGVVDDSERGGESGGGSRGDCSSEGDGALAVIGNALGGMAVGVASVAGGLGGALVGAARGGFGVGRIFGRGKVDLPLGEEVSGAIVNGESRSVLPESLLANGDEVVDGEKAGFKDASLFGDSDSDLQECEGVGGARDAYAESRLWNAACGEDAENGVKLPLSAPAEEEGSSSGFEDFVSQSTVRGEEVDAFDPLVAPYSEAGPMVEDEGRRPDNDEILVAAEPPTKCRSEGQDNYGETGLEGSDCADVPEGVGPQRGTEATLSGEGKRVLGSGTIPPRPTALQAAEADALVGEAMVTYWATFGKVSEPLRVWSRERRARLQS